jgi:hypothetical protein
MIPVPRLAPPHVIGHHQNDVRQFTRMTSHTTRCSTHGRQHHHRDPKRDAARDRNDLTDDSLRWSLHADAIQKGRTYFKKRVMLIERIDIRRGSTA